MDKRYNSTKKLLQLIAMYIDEGTLSDVNCGDGKGSLQLRDAQGKSILGYTKIPINQYPNFYVASLSLLMICSGV